MIQFNLLPDVKQEFVKVNRTKRLVVAISVLASAAAILIFLLLFVWDGLQKKNLNDINHDISTNKSQLLGTPNLNKILTIQNQLNSLPTLDSQNPMASRLFSYLSQITPDQATISSFDIDFTQHTVTITGNADSLKTVNVFADTLKFTTYSTANQTGAQEKAFSNVVLSSFGFASGTTNGTTYTFNLDFDPNLFASSDNIKLTVPNEVTTRSVLQQPTDLFKQGTK